MTRTWTTTAAAGLILLAAALTAPGGQRGDIHGLGAELEGRAAGLAEESFDRFKGFNGAISEGEQAVLFKAESFAAACRLFLRLAEEGSDYFRADFRRINLYTAFTYLARSFEELDAESRQAGVRTSGLGDLRRILGRMERAFASWPADDNLAYLHEKYVKARDASVWMIERRGVGRYVRRAFRNLESLWRYNHDRGRGPDPWPFLVEVPEETLRLMEEGPQVDLSFEGRMIVERSTRANRPVYLIEGGRRRGLTSPRVVERFGGWKNVFEVPAEIIAGYPEGEPIR